MKLPAVFMRGGTSKGIVFHARDLGPRARWDEVFLRAMGSPDRFGRQLDGMGGGLSSLSKVCIVSPSERADADVDYTFAQVQIREPRVDYLGNCGNMSSAIGPFAVDEGLVAAGDGEATVRIHNTNTGKIIHSTFAVSGGRAVTAGELEIPGVAGSGAPVRLDFLEPGGASTGALLPTGHALDELEVPGVGRVAVSMVDAANACVFVRARDVGLLGTELPEAIEANAEAMRILAAIRLSASVAMGIAPDLDAAAAVRSVPYVGFVSPPADSPTLSGDVVAAAGADVVVRMLSNGQPHRALPVTGSLCTAVAEAIDGSIVRTAAGRRVGGVLRLAMPSGVLAVDAEVRLEQGAWTARRGTFYRTSRRLFEGFVHA